MQLTPIQMLLAYGLNLTKLPDEEWEAVFNFLETEEEQMKMILFLKHNEKATNQEIMNELGRIVEESTQQRKSQS